MIDYMCCTDFLVKLYLCIVLVILTGPGGRDDDRGDVIETDSWYTGCCIWQPRGIADASPLLARLEY